MNTQEALTHAQMTMQDLARSLPECARQAFVERSQQALTALQQCAQARDEAVCEAQSLKRALEAAAPQGDAQT